jgi:hypothetical protein
MWSAAMKHKTSRRTRVSSASLSFMNEPKTSFHKTFRSLV